MAQRLIALAVLSALLSGCASTSNCAGWRQINPSRKDKLSSGTVSQILKHNEFGEQQGCWTPRK